MRLIDADAEIEKIDEEIKRIREKIATWEKRKKENDEGRFCADDRIMEQMSNLADCIVEKRLLQSYKTAFDIDTVLKQLKDEEEQSYVDFEKYTENISDNIDKDDDYHFLGLRRAIDIIKQKGIK